MTPTATNPQYWPSDLPVDWNGEGWIELLGQWPFFWRGASAPDIYRDANTFYSGRRGGGFELAGTIVETLDDFATLNDLLRDAGRSATLWLNSCTFADCARIERPDVIGAIVLLKGWRVSDLSTLSRFTRLKRLYLADARVTDLRPLTKLPALEALVLRNCESLRSLRALPDLARLRILELQHCELPELKRIDNLPSLESLSLPRCTTDIDLAAIAMRCRALRRLVYCGRALTSWPLAALKRLEILAVHGSDIQDCSFLSELMALRSLDLWSNEALGDVASLVNLPKLSRLNLAACLRIKSFAPLHHLPALTTLSLPETVNANELHAIIDANSRLERLDVGTPIGLASDISGVDGAVLGRLRSLREAHVWRELDNAHDLQDLQKLEYAELVISPTCHDLSFLTPLKSLRRLSLSLHKQVADVAALALLQDLRVLHVAHGPFNTSALRSSRKLVAFGMRSCGQWLESEALADLPNLMSVSISDTPLSRVWTLPTGSRLVSLELTRTGVGDISGLANARQLRELSLEGSDASINLSVVAKLPELRSLNLEHYTRKLDLSPISGAGRLASLNLAGCEWIRDPDIQGISAINSLVELSLDWDDGISDLSPLSRRTTIENLSLTGCTGICDISPLAQLPRLRALSLSGCEGVNDFSPLGRMKEIVELSLEATYVRDISFIKELPNLRYIDLTMSHDIEDVSPLVGLRRKGCTVQIAERNDELEELDRKHNDGYRDSTTN